jgi:hypothetical protein
VKYEDLKGPCDEISIAIKVAISDVIALKAKTEFTLLGGGYISVCGILADLVFLILKVLAAVVILLKDVTDTRCLSLIQALA